MQQHQRSRGRQRRHPRGADGHREAPRRVPRGEGAQRRAGGAHRRRGAAADGRSGGGRTRRADPDRRVERAPDRPGRAPLRRARRRPQDPRGRSAVPDQLPAAGRDRPAPHLLHAPVAQAALLGRSGQAGRRGDGDGVRARARGQDQEEGRRTRQTGKEGVGAMVTVTPEMLRRLRRPALFSVFGLLVFVVALYLSFPAERAKEVAIGRRPPRISTSRSARPARLSGSASSSATSWCAPSRRAASRPASRSRRRACRSPPGPAPGARGPPRRARGVRRARRDHPDAARRARRGRSSSTFAPAT